MKKIIIFLKNLFFYKNSFEIINHEEVIDLQNLCDALDKRDIQNIEKIIVSKYSGKGDISFKHYLDYECYPHKPEFYEDSMDYDFFIRGFCVIGETVYIFDDECKRHELSSMNKNWVEKFLKYVSDENNFIK